MKSLTICLGLIGWMLTLPARSNVVLDWNAAVLDAIRTETTGPTLSSRNLAILHTAIYDAVNSVLRTHQPYRFQMEPPADASPEATVVGAAHEVCVGLYPSFRARFDDLYASYAAEVDRSSSWSNSIAFGRQIGAMTLDSRTADGSATEIPYIPSEAPGQWRRTPPFFRPPLTPHWRYVTPFCLPDLEPFAPSPPPALESAEYAEALNEVKILGAFNSSVRTPEQTEIAIFWSDFSYTAMPPGHWHEIAADIARDQQTGLAETARLFALLSLAQADSAIACWETKFRYNLWRPITAIQRADEDGNPATEPDATWNHRLASPPFPAYTSGHSTFSKASAQVLTRFYGTDNIRFTARSDSLPGVRRSFESLAVCADEVGMSRIYGGIHFQFDNREGKRVGAKIGEYVSSNYLLSNLTLPRIDLIGVTGSSATLLVHGHIGRECVIEASSDLSHWSPMATNSATAGGFFATDTATTHNARFYRVRER